MENKVRSCVRVHFAGRGTTSRQHAHPTASHLQASAVGTEQVPLRKVLAMSRESWGSELASIKVVGPRASQLVSKAEAGTRSQPGSRSDRQPPRAGNPEGHAGGHQSRMWSALPVSPKIWAGHD